MTNKTIQPKYIICDLDGCLINTSWIWRIIRGEELSQDERFDIFNRLANAEATQIEIPLYKYLCFKASGGLKIHFLTARSELIEVETINFLQKRFGLIYGKDFTVSFRPSTDVSTPAESKAVRVQAFLDSGKQIALAIDDDYSILEMYRSKGIPTLEWKIGFIPTQVVREFGNSALNLINEKEEMSLN